MTSARITLRNATEADVSFIAELIERTMRSYVEQTYGSYSRELTLESVEPRVAAGHFSIVELEGRSIGAIAVEREPTHIQLAQLYVLPEQQNRGIGTRLLRELAREAQAAGKPLRIRVLAVNPARRLYAREGFVAYAETPERVFMERAAART